MRLSKKERQAITLMRNILDAIEHDRHLRISYADASLIYAVFGYDLRHDATCKKDVEEFVHGKEQVYVSIMSRMSWTWNLPDRYCFFPFQVKSKKEVDE